MTFRQAFAPFLEAYQHHGRLPTHELSAVDVFVRMRCAVQRFYFSWRIANDIGTGLTDAAESQQSLDDPRFTWVGLSLAGRIQFLVAQRAPAFFRPAGRKNDTQ